MRMVSTSFCVKRGSAVLVVCCALALGCSSKSDAGSANTSAGSSSVAGAEQTSGGGGASAVGGADGAGESAGGASAGSVATGGAGGSVAGESAGGSAGASGAAGGSSAGAGGSTATCGMTGTQADPGTMGDGKLTINGPYTPAPESKMRLNAAPIGKINGMPVGTANLPPLIYAAKSRRTPASEQDAQVRVLDLRSGSVQSRLSRSADGVSRRHSLRPVRTTRRSTHQRSWTI